MTRPSQLDAEISEAMRARHIVQLAAKETKIEALRSWLFEDSRGAFEKMAKRFLELSAPRAIELGLTAKQVDDAIAIELLVSASQAMLADAEKTKTKGKKKRP